MTVCNVLCKILSPSPVVVCKTFHSRSLNICYRALRRERMPFDSVTGKARRAKTVVLPCVQEKKAAQL